MSQLSRKLGLILATGLGTGYAPVAPGTFGSMLGIALHVALFRIAGHAGPLIGCLVLSATGVWAASLGEAHFGAHDPGHVVIDEIAGQLLTLLFVPVTAQNLAVGFVLFRLLDVLKPFPARRLENLPGGSGIMADDLMVAVYACVILHGLNWLLPDLMGAR